MSIFTRIFTGLFLLLLIISTNQFIHASDSSEDNDTDIRLNESDDKIRQKQKSKIKEKISRKTILVRSKSEGDKNNLESTVNLQRDPPFFKLTFNHKGNNRVVYVLGSHHNKKPNELCYSGKLV